MAFIWYDKNGVVIRTAKVNDADRPAPMNAGMIAVPLSIAVQIEGSLDRYRVVDGILKLDGVTVAIPAAQLTLQEQLDALNVAVAKLAAMNLIADAGTNLATDLNILTSTLGLLASNLNTTNARVNVIATNQNTLFAALKTQGLMKTA